IPRRACWSCVIWAAARHVPPPGCPAWDTRSSISKAASTRGRQPVARSHRTSSRRGGKGSPPHTSVHGGDDRRKGRALLGRGFEARAGADLHTMSSGDVDGLAGGRVAAGSSSALDTLHRQDARDGHLLALGDGIEHNIAEGREHLVGVGLGYTGLLGEGGDEVVAGESHENS